MCERFVYFWNSIETQGVGMWGGSIDRPIDFDQLSNQLTN